MKFVFEVEIEPEEISAVVEILALVRFVNDCGNSQPNCTRIFSFVEPHIRFPSLIPQAAHSSSQREEASWWRRCAPGRDGGERLLQAPRPDGCPLLRTADTAFPHHDKASFYAIRTQARTTPALRVVAPSNVLDASVRRLATEDASVVAQEVNLMIRPFWLPSKPRSVCAVANKYTGVGLSPLCSAVCLHHHSTAAQSAALLHDRDHAYSRVSLALAVLSRVGSLD